MLRRVDSCDDVSFPPHGPIAGKRPTLIRCADRPMVTVRLFKMLVFELIQFLVCSIV